MKESEKLQNNILKGLTLGFNLTSLYFKLDNKSS